MPLINRIEVSNFMNSRREDPWRPDWTFQGFDLKGENTAINMPNGRGKSTIVHVLLAMLAYDKSLNDLRLRHFAPQSTGHFSHVRIETNIWADDDSPVDLIAQSGGDFGGYPMVFGIYGNSGESSSLKLYAYRGTLEECPVGRREGNRVTLTGNTVFLDKLSVMPGRFPATQRDETRVNWREYVAGIFDMPSIEQQLVYQKAKGAEGSSGYFDVNPPRGRSFSETVFYERLAPELLVDMMGNVEEFSDERGIEDTIHQKVQGIIKAKVRTAKTADDLEKTRHVLEELERVKGKADAVLEAKAEADRKISEFSLHYMALKTLVVDDPVPGMPHTPPEEAPLLARAMVMQGGNWFLPDRAFEVFTGEKPSALNQRASSHQIATDVAEKSQLIDFDFDLKIRDVRGNPNQLYSTESARAILTVTTVFSTPYTGETAIQAIKDAFAWVEEHGDTNPARLERRKLKTRQTEITGKRLDLAGKRDALFLEIKNLKDEQQRIGEQQAEFRNMSLSGLFSESELSSPAETGQKVLSEFSVAEDALTTHQRLVAENKSVFGEWQEFVYKHRQETDPSELAEMLEQIKREAETALDGNREALAEANQVTRVAKKDAGDKVKLLALLSEKSEKIVALRPMVLAFNERFGGENPDGLARLVKEDLSRVEKRQANIGTERAGMKDALASLNSFSERYGSNASPKDWLGARNAERTALTEEMSKLQENIKNLGSRRADLDKAAVAPSKVAREVLELAGSDALPLHAVIDDMELPQEKKERVLSMFSALLFSPVYSDSARAAEIAGKLAAKGVESPVFVFAELADFCRNANIVYDGSVARTWLVGVRTRPVDCLLDPTLVDGEKKLLDRKIKEAKEFLATKQRRFDELDPEGEDAITARKAREAIEKGYPAKDGDLKAELEGLEVALPRLRDRASDEAANSIRGAIEYCQILAGTSEDFLAEELAKADEAARLAHEHLEHCEGNVESLSKSREGFQKAFTDASVNATNIPKLKRIRSFIDTDGPAFMKAAGDREQQLGKSKQNAEKRRVFRFDLAESFVKSGEKRPQEIEARLSVIEPKLTNIVDVLIPAEETKLDVIGKRLPELEGSISEIDNFIRELRKKYREMATTDCVPVRVAVELLAAHPLSEAVVDVRHAGSPKEIATALLALREPLSDIEATSLKHDVDNSRLTLTTARNALSGEIERVKGDANLALNEQMRIGLERAKEDVRELLRMIEATTENYNKSLVANETARTHLDEEWENIGSWLENFTRRLPSNFDAMRSVFKPARDSVSGDIVTAGFDIEARIADMKDVRTVLTGIVEKVERGEKSREMLGDDEKLRSGYEKSMRKEIREEFYRNVIIEPRIRVCIPSISRKPLPLEKNMASSGQGVAMTLLWIVKMADYVTERELQRQNVSSAARRRVRSIRTQFVIIDGAFSHLSDKRLITDALEGVRKTRGKFQLVITGHDPNYKNDFAYFPTYIVAREIGGNLMYADSETRRLLAPEEIGSRNGAMELASWHKLSEAAT